MVYLKHVRRHNIQNVSKKMLNIIHIAWYPQAPVFCDGKLIMKIGSTQYRLIVDVWSGNHPFYNGSQKILDTEGHVERFVRKYGIEYTVRMMEKEIFPIDYL